MTAPERPPVGPGPPAEERYSASNPGLALFGALAIAVGLGIAWALTSAAGAPIRLLFIGGILLIFIVLFSRVTLILRAGDATIALGPGTWELIEIKYPDITSVEVVHAKTLGYGGHGWPLRRAILVRPGEALRISRRDHRPFVVTVDRATSAVETLQERSAPRRHSQP